MNSAQPERGVGEAHLFIWGILLKHNQDPWVPQHDIYSISPDRGIGDADSR